MSRVLAAWLPSTGVSVTRISTFWAPTGPDSNLTFDDVWMNTVWWPPTLTTRTDALRSSCTQAWIAALVLQTIFFPPDTRLNLFLQSGVLQEPGLILVRPEFILGFRGTPLLKFGGSLRTLKSLLPPSGSLVSRVSQSWLAAMYLQNFKADFYIATHNFWYLRTMFCFSKLYCPRIVGLFLVFIILIPDCSILDLNIHIL